MKNGDDKSFEFNFKARFGLSNGELFDTEKLKYRTPTHNSKTAGIHHRKMTLINHLHFKLKGRFCLSNSDLFDTKKLKDRTPSHNSVAQKVKTVISNRARMYRRKAITINSSSWFGSVHQNVSYSIQKNDAFPFTLYKCVRINEHTDKHGRDNGRLLLYWPWCWKQRVKSNRPLNFKSGTRFCQSNNELFDSYWKERVSLTKGLHTIIWGLSAKKKYTKNKPQEESERIHNWREREEEINCRNEWLNDWMNE